jgi:DNA repair exonuclease SbcCD ATPase subunit
MRRLYLKFVLWMSGYCTNHLRRQYGAWFNQPCCPVCNREAYEEARDRIDRQLEELERLNAAR